jgi:hypothetical protein
MVRSEPHGYLEPPLRGLRLQGGEYVAIEPVQGRLPSEAAGLHLEENGPLLKLYDPVAGCWLLTPQEARQRAEAENQQLRQEIKRLCQSLSQPPGDR